MSPRGRTRHNRPLLWSSKETTTLASVGIFQNRRNVALFYISCESPHEHGLFVGESLCVILDIGRLDFAAGVGVRLVREPVSFGMLTKKVPGAGNIISHTHESRLMHRAMSLALPLLPLVEGDYEKLHMHRIGSGRDQCGLEMQKGNPATAGETCARVPLAVFVGTLRNQQGVKYWGSSACWLHMQPSSLVLARSVKQRLVPIRVRHQTLHLQVCNTALHHPPLTLSPRLASPHNGSPSPG